MSTCPYLHMSVAAVWRSLCVDSPSGLIPAATICFFTAFCMERVVSLPLFLEINNALLSTRNVLRIASHFVRG